MAGDGGFAKPLALAAVLAAGLVLIREGRGRDAGAGQGGGQGGGDWRNLDPEFSVGGFEDSRLGAVTLRPRQGRRPPAPDPLDFTPDIKGHVEDLREGVGDRTGNVGAVLEIERHCRRFAMLVFRRLGRRPGKTSGLDAARAVDDLVRIRADIVNAVQALYISSHRERVHAVLDRVTEGVMRDASAYVRAVRALGGAPNVYEGGRGFPSPWNEGADPDYDLVG